MYRIFGLNVYHESDAHVCQTDVENLKIKQKYFEMKRTFKRMFSVNALFMYYYLREREREDTSFEVGIKNCGTQSS